MLASLVSCRYSFALGFSYMLYYLSSLIAVGDMDGLGEQCMDGGVWAWLWLALGWVGDTWCEGFGDD